MEREVPDQETEEDAEEEASVAVTIDEEEGMTEGAVDSIAVEVAAEMIEGSFIAMDDLYYIHNYYFLTRKSIREISYWISLKL